MMFVEIQVTKGRRVRHPSSRRVLMEGVTHKVEWGPVWERKLRYGDIERIDAKTNDQAIPIPIEAMPEVNE